jgi:TatD-related deoxyribonuclease
MAGNMRIYDNHMHLSPTGMGVEAAKLFEKAGGTAMMLTHIPPHDIPLTSARDYETAFRRTLDLANVVRGATKLKVYVAVGPYPVELIRLKDTLGLENAVALQNDAMDLVGGLVSEGEVTAIGEIGRPHFPTDRDIVEACNGILLHGMKVAKENGCPVVIHSESATPAICEEFAKMADSVGLPREKVVKHFSPPLVRPEENHGIMPSILAKEEPVRRAIENGGRFFMETDYIDDLKRPGAVLGPATVPKRTKALMQGGIMTDEMAREIHEEWPRRIYGIETG